MFSSYFDVSEYVSNIILSLGLLLDPKGIAQEVSMIPQIGFLASLGQYKHKGKVLKISKMGKNHDFLDSSQSVFKCFKMMLMML